MWKQFRAFRSHFHSYCARFGRMVHWCSGGSDGDFESGKSARNCIVSKFILKTGEISRDFSLLSSTMRMHFLIAWMAASWNDGSQWRSCWMVMERLYHLRSNELHCGTDSCISSRCNEAGKVWMGKGGILWKMGKKVCRVGSNINKYEASVVTCEISLLLFAVSRACSTILISS